MCLMLDPPWRRNIDPEGRGYSAGQPCQTNVTAEWCNHA